MNNEILINEIEFWDDQISKLNGEESVIYEIAFFKIFVKLELFLGDLFIHYSTGKMSEVGYIPARKLDFQDERHLKGVLKNGNSVYIDYLEKIKNISKHIFKDEHNPFDLIFSDASYSGYYNQMKILRNYIAHESEESKQKYIKEVLNNRVFIQPYKHLGKINRRYSKTYYTIYIEKIKQITEILLDPGDFFATCETNSCTNA